MLEPDQQSSHVKREEKNDILRNDLIEHQRLY